MGQETFFGRTAYLEILEKRVIALKDGYRQNIALIGDELVGKTALVHTFLHRFVDSRFITLYLETRPETLAVFAKRFIGVLLYNFLCNAQIPLKEDLDFLIQKSSPYIPKTISAINEIIAELERRKKENIIGKLFSLTSLIHQETGKFCVVFIDEFQNLEGLQVKSLYKEWAQRLMLEKTTMYIITSSAPYKAKAVLAQDLSLLFGNFEVITVEPFDIRASAGYLDTRLGADRIPEQARNFIIHFTGGYPLYLELIAGELIKSHEASLDDTLERLLFSSSGILHQRFTAYLKRFQDNQFSNDYVAILHAISNGHNKVKEIAHILKKPIKEAGVRVTYLVERDVLARFGDFLKISDRVFGFWLKFVHQEKLQSLTFDAFNQQAMFARCIAGLIEEFSSSCAKTIGERMTELLRLFADERMQMERRKFTLNHFREIKPLDFKSRSLREGLICRSTDSLWIIGFTDESLTEEDIAEFSRECKKYRNKLQRKIIVTLRDIDTNSRLKALEEKIWTWDVNSVNQMFDLYSKPRIIANV